MPLLLQPWGLLALLGIPALVVIHCWQQQPRRVEVSTLFLWEAATRQPLGGRRWTRFWQSWLFWVQCLLVLVLTWLLCAPQFLLTGSVVKIALVVDSSRSMQAFRPALDRQVQALLRDTVPQGQTVNWLLLESDIRRASLYRGGDAQALRARLAAWQACGNGTDPLPALRLARSIAGADGTVIYLTDTPPSAPLPASAEWCAVGSPLPNVALAGLRFTHEQERLQWQVLVQNHSDQTQQRQWTLRLDNGQITPPQVVELAPFAAQVLNGVWPEHCQRLELSLNADAFALDDQMAIMRPQPKPLTLNAVPTLEKLGEKLTAAIDDLKLASAATADILLTEQRGAAPLPAATRATLCFLAAAEAEKRADKPPRVNAAPIVAIGHALTDGLQWQGILVPEAPRLQPSADANILLWQEQTPLLFIEPPTTQNGAETLCWNTTLAGSNLRQSSSFLIVLHRWFEQQRRAKRAPVQGNVECAEELHDVITRATVATGANPVPEVTVQKVTITGEPDGPASPQSLPPRLDTPGFYQLSADGEPRWDLAAQVADPQESRFASCATATSLTAEKRLISETKNRHDPFWRWLVVLAVALLGLSWHLAARQARVAPRA